MKKLIFEQDRDRGQVRILFAIKAIDDITGGAERVLADVSAGLAARGHDVSVLSFDAPGGRPFYKFDERVRRISLGIGAAKEYTGVLETMKRMGPLRKAIVAEKPDVVVAFMHSMFIPASIALIGSGIPVVASEHIVPQHYDGKPGEFALLTLCGLLAKKITVLSEPIKDMYPSILRSRMVVMPNPVAAQSQHARPAASHLGRKTILNVGRLTEQKDQKTLIGAFSRLAVRFPDWDVRIIGTGELKDELQQQVRDLSLSGRVTLAGTTADIGMEYLQANIFALPSLYESFGLVTAEAMSYGLPALGFADCPGTNELIKDGENGILVHGEDRIGAFANGLERLMTSDDLRVQYGQSGIQSVQKFSPEKIVERWEKLLGYCAR